MRSYGKFVITTIIVVGLVLLVSVGAVVRVIWLTSTAAPPWIGFAGGLPAPSSPSANIQLATVKVTMSLEVSRYTVTEVFDFINSAENSSEPNVVLLPKSGFVWGSDEAPSPDLVYRDTWVGTEQVRLSEEFNVFNRTSVLLARWIGTSIRGLAPYVKDDRWFRACVTMPPRKRTSVCVRYEAEYAESPGLASTRWAIYRLDCGSGWKGTIEKATFLIDGSAIEGSRKISVTFPTRATLRVRSEKAVKYEMKDFEPQLDEIIKVKTM